MAELTKKNIDELVIKTVTEIYSNYRNVEKENGLDKRCLPIMPSVAVICGTGLETLASLTAKQDSAITIPFEMFEHLPKPTVDGHKGNFIFSPDARIILQSGRCHYYEAEDEQGKELSERERFLRTIFSTLVFAKMGVKYLIVTDAAGALMDNTRVGELVVISDFCNKFGFPDLTKFYGPRFTDPRHVSYPKHMVKIANTVASMMGYSERLPANNYTKINEGRFALVEGPTFESFAEQDLIRNAMAHTFEGITPQEKEEKIKALERDFPYADVVGMAGVPEVYHFGLKRMDIEKEWSKEDEKLFGGRGGALHIALATDLGYGNYVTTHEGNQDVGRQTSPLFTAFVHNIVYNLILVSNDLLRNKYPKLAPKQMTQFYNQHGEGVDIVNPFVYY